MKSITSESNIITKDNEPP